MIGQQIKHYSITEKLGEGGMGVVYKARDSKLNRDVALKFLPRTMALGAEERERFKLEAQAAAALNHAHIATIYEIDEVDEQEFIAMEYIEGQTLDERIRAGSISVDEALRIARQIVEGLQEAHEHNVVHRDIKPANVMLTAKGQAKVMDFGLAKVAHAPNITQAGSTLGTPSYMSPEQAGGGAVDHRTDIWSLGVMLYEMLTGERPFKGEHESAVIYSILNEAPAPPSHVNADVPESVDAVVLQALAKRPDERIQSAESLVAALGGGVDVSAVGVLSSRSQASAATKSRRPLAIGVAAVLLAAVGVVAVLSTSSESRSIRSLAVMPLLYDEADSTAEYLADGISESLISNLSKLPDIRVMSWYAVWRMKGKGLSPAEVAEQLDVEGVIVGTLKPRGDGLRLSLELVDARDHRQIWGNQYEKPMSELLALQDEITSEVYRHIRSDVSPAEQTQVADYKTENSQAYAHYLKGRYYWNKMTPADLRRSVDQFQQALDRDPTYALAYTGLADAWSTLAMFAEPPETAYPRAKAYVQTALKLEPNLAEAHYSLATIHYFYDWDWVGADAELKRALELNPNHAFAYQLRASRLSDQGRHEESIQEIEKALALDPLSHRLNCSYGGLLLDAREYDKAISQANETLQLEYTCAGEHVVLGMSYVGKDMFDDGFAHLDTAKEQSGGGGTNMLVVMTYAHMAKGEVGLARKHLDMLLAAAEHERVDPYTFAAIYGSLGESNRALDYLERAYEERSPSLTGIKTSMAFDDLRTDPRYVAVVQKMGLPI